MKKKFKYHINYTAIRVAIASFILGTICLVLFKTSGNTGFVGIGYCYTLFAALVNSIMLLLILVHAIRHFKDINEHLKTIGIILINIPITLFYLNLV